MFASHIPAEMKFPRVMNKLGISLVVENEAERGSLLKKREKKRGGGREGPGPGSYHMYGIRRVWTNNIEKEFIRVSVELPNDNKPAGSFGLFSVPGTRYFAN